VYCIGAALRQRRRAGRRARPRAFSGPGFAPAAANPAAININLEIMVSISSRVGLVHANRRADAACASTGSRKSRFNLRGSDPRRRKRGRRWVRAQDQAGEGCVDLSLPVELGNHARNSDAGKVEALECASCVGPAIVGSLLLAGLRVRATIQWHACSRHAGCLCAYHTAFHRQHCNRQGDDSNQNGATGAHGSALGLSGRTHRGQVTAS